MNPMEKAALWRAVRRSSYWDVIPLSVVKIVHSDDAGNSYPHEHPNFYEIVLVSSGSATHVFDGNEMPIAAGNLFLVPPGVTHHYRAPRPFEIYNLIFGEEMLSMFQEDLSGLSGFHLLFNTPATMKATGMVGFLEPEFFPEAIALLEQMVTNQRHMHYGGRTRLIIDFLRLLLLFSRECRPGGSETRNMHIAAISRLLSALDIHYAEPWDLARMSRHVGMSERNFRIHFAALTGSNPVTYLLDLRLRKAAILLQRSRQGIGSVAYACGFGDSNYFSHCFTRRFHCNPSGFRKLAATPAEEQEKS